MIKQVNQIQLPSADLDTYGNAHNNATNIGALAFDTQQELLWIGDQFVRPIIDIFNHTSLISTALTSGSSHVLFYLETRNLHEVPGSYF